MTYVQVVEFPADTSIHYAHIGGELKRSGKRMGSNDLFIAAHARSSGLTLVTNNTHGLRRIPKLKLADWVTF